MAKLDSLYRSGTLDPTFDEASSRDVRDLLHLIRVIAFEGQMGALLREGSIRLNPTFGRYSGLVGGADADLIAGTTLVDLKVTKFPDFTDMHLAQLLGYLILADRYRQAERRRFPSLSRVGLYFARAWGAFHPRPRRSQRQSPVRCGGRPSGRRSKSAPSRVQSGRQDSGQRNKDAPPT